MAEWGMEKGEGRSEVVGAISAFAKLLISKPFLLVRNLWHLASRRPTDSPHLDDAAQGQEGDEEGDEPG